MAVVEVPVRFPSADGSGEVRGVLHRPVDPPIGGFIVAHGRSGSMGTGLVRRIAAAATADGWLACRMNFRYADERGSASKDLSREADDLRGAVRFVRTDLPRLPIVVAGASMGARVCARASSDPEISGVIALGYPLHPRFRPEVRNPPEWPMIAKPILFVQGDQDPFCDLARLREDLPRLRVPHELVVIRDAGHSFESRGPKRDALPEVWAAASSWLTPRFRK